MTDPAVPALPDRAPSFRWRHFAVRLLFVGILLAVAGALPGGRGAPEKFRNREGEIARERVVAPYEFRVEKDETSLRREQEQAAAAVAPVFVEDARVSADMLTRFATFHGKALAVVQDPKLQPGERAARIHELGVPLSDESIEAFAAPGRARRALNELGSWLQEIYQAGVVAEKRGGQVLGYRSVTLREG